MSVQKQISSSLAAAFLGLILVSGLGRAQGLLGDLMAERVVTVDLWAADKKGKAADPSLEDIELLEDGQPVQITGLEPGKDSLRLVLFFDNLHTQRAGRNRVIEDLSRTLEQGLGSNTQIMVVTYDGVLAVRQAFTANTGDVISALHQVAGEESRGDEIDGAHKDLLDQLKGTKGDCESSIPKIRSHAEGVYDEVEKSLAGLETVIRSLSTFDDRKAVVAISDGLELFSGQDVFEHLAAECGGDTESMGKLARDYDSSKALIHLAAVANSKNTTIVAVEAFGPLSSSGGGARAKQKTSTNDQPTGMVTKSADGVPMVPVAGLGESAGGAPTPEQLRARNLQSSVAFLAKQTGGITVFNTKSFKSRFDSLPQDLLPYYTLAFSPERQADGRVHELEVRSAKKGIETRYNRSYLDQKASRSYADRLLAYLLYDSSETNRLGIEVEIQTAEEAEEDLHTAQITVPLASVVLRPHQGELVGRLSFIAVSQNTQGEMTRLQQSTTDVAPMPGEAEHVESFPIEMLPGDQVLAVAVVDVGGESASFIKQEVVAPSGGNQSPSP